MSLEVHTDKQDIHTLPRYEGAVSARGRRG
jgi:hypothetical protein